MSEGANSINRSKSKIFGWVQSAPRPRPKLEIDKLALVNVISQTAKHNKRVEESEMWKNHQLQNQIDNKPLTNMNTFNQNNYKINDSGESQAKSKLSKSKRQIEPLTPHQDQIINQRKNSNDDDNNNRLLQEQDRWGHDGFNSIYKDRNKSSLESSNKKPNYLVFTKSPDNSSSSNNSRSPSPNPIKKRSEIRSKRRSQSKSQSRSRSRSSSNSSRSSSSASSASRSSRSRSSSPRRSRKHRKHKQKKSHKSKVSKKNDKKKSKKSRKE